MDETEQGDRPRKSKGGRPLGSMSRLAREAREKAQATGLLPHEILLSIARGEVQDELVVDPVEGRMVRRYFTPEFDKRVDAAKAAAPYYAPKISTVEVIAGVSDDELDAIIRSAAAEAEVSLGPDGEGEEGAAEEGGAGGARERRRGRP